MKKCEKVRVNLGRKSSYDIQIGPGAIHSVGGWLKPFRSKRAFIIADEKLTDARRAVLAGLAKAGWETHEFPVRAGESLKDIESVYPLYGHLIKAKANRDSVLFALGGGSVGDAAGFVAATYLRGISWVGLPTTLLSQVDSSVGGKTGINHTDGKNLIGAFHQPSLVVCDTHFLRTLSSREIVSGFGETVKYGFIFDPKFHAYLEANVGRFLELDAKVLAYSVKRSLQWKAKAVAQDEFDRKGIREVLNFGHTFGHALESVTHYESYQHGEAVLWGMRFALALSQVRRKLAAKTRAQLDSFLATIPVPPIPANFGPAEFFAHMSRDKKVRDGRLHFVLLRRLGETVSDSRVTERDLHAAYELILGGQVERRLAGSP
jgi:3-dehydroquinate synthase